MKLPTTTSPTGEADQLTEWLQTVGERVPALDALLACSSSEQIERGYGHTLREICQQPITWNDTATLAAAHAGMLAEITAGVRNVVLTGSGSSVYATECLALQLQVALGVPVRSLAAGQLLTHGKQLFPSGGPSLLISLARSGDSPESYAVVNEILAAHPESRHLIITCNRNGLLVRAFKDHSRVRALTLAPETCDRSLVMTSSFTNMVVAGSALASLGDLHSYQTAVAAVSRAGAELLLRHTAALSDIAAGPFTSAVYLASGDRLGAANEAALKMLESTAGRVHTFSETFLGLRHGPMSAVHDDTLVVCMLSADTNVRPYELDLIAELNRKRIGSTRVIIGADIPSHVAREGDVVIDTGSLADDNHATILHVAAGQLLAFFRCLQEGLQPDSPSSGGIINRVVEKFPIYSNGSKEHA